MTRTFAVTWDYLCPFARNAHEHIVTGLRAGADWDVHFTPFSLKQAHAEERGGSVWSASDPLAESGVLALLCGIEVRDQHPERFLDVHLGLFAARHDHGLDVRDPLVVADVLTRAGVDADAILAAVREGGALETLRKEHEHAAYDLAVFGVPTFVAGDDAVFVRFMHRPNGDADVAINTVERVVDLLTGWPDLNEFKHTRLPR